MTVQELALTESRSLREQYADRTDVLDKVKALALLPDGVHADIPIVAAYFEVSTDAVEKTIQRNRDELKDNGLDVLRGEEYRRFAADNLSVANARARSATVFSRRAILNMAQLLRDSPVARQIRTYLLDVEEIAAPEMRNEAIERAQVARAQLSMLQAAEGLAGIDRDWLKVKERAVVARGLGEEPEIDPLDVPLYVPDFIKSKGVPAKRDIESIQSWFGRRVASLYEAEYGEKPGKRQSELPNGQIRETYAWTKRHLPFFEEAWDRWYAAEYTPQGVLDIVEDGAA